MAGARSPATSRHVRALFYLGEGILFGLALYLVVFASVALFPSLLTDGQLSVLVALLLLVVALKVVAAALGRGTANPSPSMREWHDTRRWWWIAVLGIFVAGVLVTGSALAWGWEWPSRDALLLVMGTMLLGATFRVSAMYLSSSETVDRERVT